MSKKVLSVAIVLIMVLGISTTQASAALTATPTSSTVLVNGSNVAFDAYNIEGSNYFKLRDLAYVLRGTVKQFEVVWDGGNNAIMLTSGVAYTPLGDEMASKGSGSKTPTPTRSKIYLNGREVHFAAYNIEGNNYFKLRDIGQTFNFGVDWDGARNTIVIDTSKRYTDGAGATSYSASYFGAAQGSAKVLEGRTLLVSIFITNEESAWNTQDIERAREKLNAVKSFIEAEGRRYGKEIDLICDFQAYADLRYDFAYPGVFHRRPDDGIYTEEIWRSYERAVLNLHNFTEEIIPYLELADKYETDSIAYVVFLNYQARSNSTPYNAGYDPIERYHERLIIYSGLYDGSSPLAHELLHVFGGVDLFYESAYYGICNELVEYVELNYPNDLMFSGWAINSDGYLERDRVLNEISPVTAYCLGWLDDIPELIQFPALRRVVPAALTNQTN